MRKLHIFFPRKQLYIWTKLAETAILITLVPIHHTTSICEAAPPCGAEVLSQQRRARPLLPRSQGLAPSLVGAACSQWGFLQIPSPCQFTLNLKNNSILLSKHFYLLPEKWKISTKKFKSIVRPLGVYSSVSAHFSGTVCSEGNVPMLSSTVATVAMCLLSTWCGQCNWGSGFLIFVHLMNLNMHMG